MDDMKKKEGMMDEAEDAPEADSEGEETTLSADIQDAIAPCLEKIEKGEYATKNEAIDALIADLEAARESEPMGGLGGSEGMPLPDEEA